MEAPLTSCLGGFLDPIAEFTHINAIYDGPDDQSFGDSDTTTLAESISHKNSHETRSLSIEQFDVPKRNWFSRKLSHLTRLGTVRSERPKQNIDISFPGKVVTGGNNLETFDSISEPGEKFSFPSDAETCFSGMEPTSVIQIPLGEPTSLGSTDSVSEPAGKSLDSTIKEVSISASILPALAIRAGYKRKPESNSPRSRTSSNTSDNDDTAERASPQGISGYISYNPVSMSRVSSMTSGGDSRNSTYSSESSRRGKKRTKTQYPREGEMNKKYQCTWCCQGFAIKYTWIRHQETDHCPQKEYVCMPNGPIEYDGTREGHCVFCQVLHPTEQHLSEHRAIECCSKAKEKRTFYRRDCLTQHVKSMHIGSMPSLSVGKKLLEHWEQAVIPLNDGIYNYCGFCENVFEDWKERNDHIAEHFDDGYDMTSWTQNTGHGITTFESSTRGNLSASLNGAMKWTGEQREKEREQDNSRHVRLMNGTLERDKIRQANDDFKGIATACTRTNEVCPHRPDRRPAVDRIKECRSQSDSPQLTGPCPCQRCRDSNSFTETSRPTSARGRVIITYD